VENLTNLTILELSDNLISKIQGIDRLQVLEEFWLTNNKVELFAELEKLRVLSSLKTIYLERCPIYAYPDYKLKILEVCPWIKQIDALMV
jgi:protein phosphatase 1 regulatory subunit 7